MAQHDSGGITGGGLIGGSTSRPSTKPATKPASKPATTTTTPRRRTTPVTTPVNDRRRAPTSITSKGETLYKAQRYREALEPYLKATQINPSMTSALYRISWIYNDLEEYNSAIDPLKRVLALQPNNAAATFELGYAYKKLEQFRKPWRRSNKLFASSPTTLRHITRSADRQRTEKLRRRYQKSENRTLL